MAIVAKAADSTRSWPGLVWPVVMVLGFFGVPLFLLIRASFANRDPAVYQGTGWTLHAYGQLFQPLVIDRLLFSAGLAIAVATVSLVIAFLATYFITRMTRSSQVLWLVFFLTTLALSEVLITFAWQIILSKRAGISNIAVFLGLLDRPVSLQPSFFAVVSSLVYFVIPLNVITLFPGLSRLDPSYMEAARTMRARPYQAFFNVIVPLMRKPIATAYLTSVVITIGAFVSPLILGGPANWTIGVVISETAVSGQNLPLAAAMSILFMAVTGLLLVTIGRLGGKGYTQ